MSVGPISQVGMDFQFEDSFAVESCWMGAPVLWTLQFFSGSNSSVPWTMNIFRMGVPVKTVVGSAGNAGKFNGWVSALKKCQALQLGCPVVATGRIKCFNGKKKKYYAHRPHAMLLIV